MVGEGLELTFGKQALRIAQRNDKKGPTSL